MDESPAVLKQMAQIGARWYLDKTHNVYSCREWMLSSLLLKPSDPICRRCPQLAAVGKQLAAHRSWQLQASRRSPQHRQRDKVLARLARSDQSRIGFAPVASSLLNSEASSCLIKSAKARALVLDVRPLGKTAQRSIGGSSQSVSTSRTLPDANSGPNIQLEATARPIPANTASRTPSAAVSRTRPLTVTELWVVPFLKFHTAPPLRKSYTTT